MFRRFLRILRVVIRYRLDRLVPKEAPWWIHVLLAPLKLVPAPKTSRAAAVRLALEDLGPIFVKFGQLLSTRRDLFTPETSDELAKLQDRVPPFDSNMAVARIEAELGEPVDTVFASFEREPMASASVAQVHAATLKTGEEVVVKVIRPNLEPTIRRDIALMMTVANLVERYWSEGKRMHPVQVVKDYEHTILNELNLQIEAANAAKLRDNWLNSGKLYVPRVHWDYCGPNVMVMERIYGVMASDIEALKAAGTDLEKLAHLGVDIFFTQVFEQNFFHADMHPGNVYVDITDPANPTYIALDCAIMGSLTETDKNYLAKNLLAFFQEDYREVAKLHVKSGWVPHDTDVDAFEAVIRSVCEPIFKKPMKEISFGKVLLSLFATARQFEMEVQPQLVLLQKTLLNIEGMGRQIYDELDLWTTAAPYMERWMTTRLGVRGMLDELRKQAPKLLERLPELPTLAVTAIDDLRELGETNRRQAETLSALREELTAQRKRATRQRVGGLALIAGFLALALPWSATAGGTEQMVVTTSIVGGAGLFWWLING